MLHRIFLLLLALISLPNLLFAQKISGNITDAATGQPLAGVNIVYGPGQGSSSDVDGRYSLVFPAPGKYLLEISYIGYKKERIEKTLAAGESVTLDIRLKTDLATLDPIVVTAGRYEQRQNEVTVSMEVVKPALIEQTNNTKFDDVIDRIPGVSVINGQANIRGTSGFSYGAGSRVLVLVDDMPLLSADAGDVKWAYIPIENVSQVEVIKGASSALFGSSALGGIIHLRSAYPTAKPRTQLQTFMGVYDRPASEFTHPFPDRPHIQSGLSGLHSQQFGKLDLTTGFYALYDQGYRQGDYSKRIRGNVNLRYRLSERLHLQLNANAMRDSAGNFLFWQSDTAAFFPNPGTNDTQLGIRYNIDPIVQYFGRNGSKHSLRNRYYFTENRASTERNTQGHLYYNEYQFQQPLKLPYFKKSMLTAGGVHLYQGINSGVLYGNRDSRNLAAYLQLDQQIWRLTYSLGFRYESFVINREKAVNYPLFRGGLNFQLLEASWLRASFGQGFRMPSVAERYVNASAGGILVIPNPQLSSERGWSSEVGVRQGWRLASFSGMLDVAGFWTAFEDMVEFNLAFSSAGVGFQAQNLFNAVATVRGIEVSTNFQGKIKKITLLGQLGYTYIDPIQVTTPLPAFPEITVTEELKYRSRHLLRSDLQLAWGRWQTGVNIRYNSFVNRIDPLFEAVIPGVANYRSRDNKGDWLFDYRLAFELHSQLQAAFIVRNLTNEAYMIVPGNIGPARHFILQLSYRLGGE